MPTRVVLDTNCLISSLVFARGRLHWLRSAWQAGLISPLACRQTVLELLRVLAYPKFSLTRADIDVLLAEFLPYAAMVEGVGDGEVPGLRDADDAMFVHLAEQGHAAYLVTGDTHLLEIAGSVSGFKIIRPAEFREMLFGEDGQ